MARKREIRWEIRIEKVPRLWAEPYIVELFFSDSETQITYAAWRWYAAGRVIIECFESREDVMKEGDVLEEGEDLLEVLTTTVKDVIEKEIEERGEFGFIAEVVTNDINVYEELLKMRNSLIELYAE